MPERTNNFALMCDLLEVSPKHISASVGADATLVSRWRTGNRKLMPGRHWATRIAEYMLVQDEHSGADVCEKLLRAYFPGQSMDAAIDRTQLLSNFLTLSGQSQPEFLQRRFELLNPLFPGRVRMPGSVYALDAGKSSFGVAGLQRYVIEFLAIASKSEKPLTLLFACDGGLDMLIGDEGFAMRMLDRLSELFDRGYRLDVCLSGDFEPATVTQFSRRWMWMHMRGHIRSYCCDGEIDPSVPGERMIVAIPGYAAFSVIDKGNAPAGAYASQVVTTGQPDVIAARIQQRIGQSHLIFNQNFLRHPDAPMRNARIDLDQPAGKISMMPHFGILPLSEYPALFGLCEEQIERIRRDFSPLVITPDQYAPTTPVRYILCQDEIDEQLMKNRHGVTVMSEMLDKQIYMTTRMLARQLRALRDLLFTHRNFEVAFVPRFMMEQFAFQLHTWGTCAAVGILPKAASTACLEPHACRALSEQLEVVWEKLPFSLRSRAESLKKLSMWEEKARRYGAI